MATQPPSQQKPTTAITPRQQREMAEQKARMSVAEALQKYRGEFERVIPQHLNPGRLVRVAQAALSRDRNLLACNMQSLMRAVMQSAILGLEIGTLGEAYVIPFKDEATFIPGYQGLIKLAIQSKAVAAIQVGAVYPGEDFDYGLGSAPFVRHKPSLKMKDPRALVAVYAVCKLVSGEFQCTIMGKEEVDAIRARSRARDSGPWVTDYEQMAIKTVIRRALKYVPKTPLLTRAMEQEDRAETGVDSSDLFDEIADVKLPGDDARDVTPNDSVSQAAAALGVQQQGGGTASDVAGLDAEHAGDARRVPEDDGRQ